MPDREKVVNGLRCIKGDLIICVDCAYSDGDGHGTYSCKAFCANDAIAMLKEQEETIKELQNAYGYLQKQFFEAQDKLLKEQEAVKPKSKTRHGEYPQIVHRCGNCNEILYRHYKHCPSCGRSVKWE